jgi:hypothetical protein
MQAITPSTPDTRPMQTSKIIEVDGIFLGAAVALPSHQGWQFVASHSQLGDMSGYRAANVTEIQRMVRQAFLAVRMASAA